MMPDAWDGSVDGVRSGLEVLTRFLNCLWMASSASLMVTPFMFRAVTSRPSGKCRAMDLSLGSVSGSFKTSGSSTVDGDLFSFLLDECVSGVLSHRSYLNESGRRRADHDEVGHSAFNKGKMPLTYQLSFWVSIAISIFFPSFSVVMSAPPSPHTRPLIWANIGTESLPRSSMRLTSAAIELGRLLVLIPPSLLSVRESTF
jgi:hypothetical protein